MSIDIVIVNFWSLPDVVKCLARLGNWTHGVVWVVDNSHDCVQAQQLHNECSKFDMVKVVIAPTNLGFGQGCNLAFDRSKADFVLLLNPDATISPDSIAILASSLQSKPHWAGVSPRTYWNQSRSFLLPVPSAQTPVASLMSALTSHSISGARLLAERQMERMQTRLHPSAPSFEVSLLAGAVLLLRRKAVLDVGGLFDPAYFMFFEDADLSLRLRKAGYRLAIVPAASAEHEYRHKAYKSGMMTTSQHYYFSKHYPAFYRWSGELTRIAAFAQPVNLPDWFKVLPKPVETAKAFAAYTGNGQVLAFSPSLQMMPALIRTSFTEASAFSEEEWNLLEPSGYVALVQSIDQTHRREWVYFERIIA